MEMNWQMGQQRAFELDQKSSNDAGGILEKKGRVSEKGKMHEVAARAVIWAVALPSYGFPDSGYTLLSNAQLQEMQEVPKVSSETLSQNSI